MLFFCIGFQQFAPAFVLFVVAASTDWLDGYFARRWGLVTQLGRILDPFADKLIICGTFIFLAAVPASGIAPWMAVVVMGRELLVTGLRSFLEQKGIDFSAEMSGKLKMVLQCVAAGASLFYLAWSPAWLEAAADRHRVGGRGHHGLLRHQLHSPRIATLSRIAATDRMRAFSLLAAAEVSEPVAWTSLLPLGFLAVVALYGWMTVLRRRRARLELLPETPHRLVPWDGGITLLSAFIYLGLSQIGTGLLMGLFFHGTAPQPAFPEADSQTLTNPQWMIAMFQAHGVTSYASVCAVAALLVGVAQARLDDFGLSLIDWRRYLKIGIIGFAVIVPPVVLLQGMLNAIWMESQHPIIVAYRASGDSRLLLWCTVAAVSVAPFVEEFFFRGVLQGWLERVIAKRSESKAIEAAEDDVTLLDVRPPDTVFRADRL